jgi:putative CocE/NonD family hydrolase
MSWIMRTRARASWARLSVSSKLHKHFSMPFQSMPVSELPPRLPVRVIKNVMVPMRDGVSLCSDIYLPKQDGRYPAILTRLPYGKREWGGSEPVKGRFWARKGYAYVAQDVRGKFKSGGVWDPFVNEVDDGYDTIDWISKQPWCNGRVGMSGYSYMGYTTLAAAVSAHPSLVCAAPGMTATDIYGVWMYKGGAFCLRTMGSWLIGEDDRREQNDLLLDYWHLPLISLGEAAGLRDTNFRLCIEHPRRDSHWARINLNDRCQRIAIPMLHMGGWYDVFLKGTLDDWREMCAQGKGAAEGNQWLVIGPDDHGSTQMNSGRIGRLEIGKSRVDQSVESLTGFFDYWLNGADNGFEKTKRVKIFVIGDNVWRDEVGWPPKKTRPTNYYLHSGGKANSLSGDGMISTEPPASEPSDTYLYDPSDPARQSLEETPWYLAQFMKDRSQTERRPDVLVYTSAELLSDLEVTGPMALRLYASSTSDSTDFMAKLVDVFQDGYAHMIQEGVLRTGSTSSDAVADRGISPATLELDIDLAATSHVIKAGHKVRVEISSSDFNRYDRNLNASGPYGREVRCEKATQIVYHDSEHPSSIVLPIVPR